MKGCAHLELDPSELEEIAPHMPHKHWIAITNNGRRKTMKSDNAVKEHTADRRCCVWVTEWKKMCLLGKSVNHY